MTIRLASTANWLRIFCATLLLFLGFGHQPLRAQPAPVPSDTVFVLPDGSFALLCLGDGGEGQQQKSGRHGCEACLIAAGALLPVPPADYISASGDLTAVDFPAAAVLVVLEALRPGSPVRGPPALFV